MVVVEARKPNVFDHTQIDFQSCVSELKQTLIRSGKLVDGVQAGMQGKPGIKYVNLLNPTIRDIDDNGMIRVAAQTIKTIPDVPSILDDEDPPIPGIGLVCPNDVVAAMEYHFYMTDIKDGLHYSSS